MKKWFTPYEALKMATSDNAELLALSGPRNLPARAARWIKGRCLRRSDTGQQQSTGRISTSLLMPIKTLISS